MALLMCGQMNWTENQIRMAKDSISPIKVALISIAALPVNAEWYGHGRRGARARQKARRDGGAPGMQPY
jgi:hypothetical protein